MRLPKPVEQPGHVWMAWTAVLVVGVLAPVLMVFATRSIAAVLIVGFALSGVSLVARVRRFSGLRPAITTASAFVILAIAFLMWMFLSLLWASDRTAARDVLLQVALVVSFGAVGFLTLPQIAPRPAFLVQAFGLALTTAIVLFDVALDFPIRRSLSGPDAAALPGSQLNRTMVVLALLLWPTVAGLLASGHRRTAGLLVLLVAAGVFSTDSQAAQLGMAAGLLTLAFAWRAPRSMSLVLAIAMGFLCLAMPVIVLHLQDILPARLFELLSSAHALHRMEIWQSYAALIPQHWVVGLGINASDTLTAAPAMAQLSPEALEPLENRHSHNMPLQVWVELGAVGAVLASGVLSALALRLGRLDAARSPWALAALACCFAIACVGHGAWQTWWLALLVAVTVWFRIRAQRH